MALLQCQYCSRSFSARMGECPACGSPADFAEPVPPGAAAGDWREGRQFAGRYVLQETIGGSLLGEIWKARDVVAPDGKAEALVALYPIPPDTVDIDAFAERIGSLRHERVAGCLAQARDGDECALVMEYAEGAPLLQYRREYAEAHGDFPVAEALRLCDQLADGLVYGHFHGMRHRDLAPKKIVVDANGDAMLLDFGLSDLAPASPEAPTADGYAAPEAWQGKPTVPETDQYALAAIFYELVSGAPPFVGDDEVLLRACVLSGDVEPLRQLSPEQNRALLRGLAKKPEERFRNCRELVLALRGVPVEGRPGTDVRPRSATATLPARSADETVDEPVRRASSRTSPSQRGSVTAKEIHQRSHSRRHATAEQERPTSTSQKGWEDVEAAEESQRGKIRWGGVALVIILLLGLVAAGLYDYHRGRQAKEAKKAAESTAEP